MWSKEDPRRHASELSLSNVWHADKLATQKDGDKQGGRGRLHTAARGLEVSPELYLVLWEQMWKLLEKAESITLT